MKKNEITYAQEAILACIKEKLTDNINMYWEESYHEGGF